MNIPFSVAHYSVYESAKKLLRQSDTPSDFRSLVGHFLSGGIAGAVAAFISNPMDVVKTTLSTQGTLGLSHKGFSDTARYIYQTAGMSGFFNGASARMLYIAPSAAISWATYELRTN